MEDRLKRLETAIIGDEKAGLVGVVDRIKDIEQKNSTFNIYIKEYIEKNEKFKNKLAGICLALTVLPPIIIQIFNLIHK